MSIYTIYRIAIWLPIFVPAALIVVVNMFDLRHQVGVVGQMVAYSLVMGGLPYLGLAAWATWWVKGRSEQQIRRVMWLAPLLMLAVYVPLALGLGITEGSLESGVGVALLGAIGILLLGYGYVALTVALRFVLGPRSPVPPLPGSPVP